MITQKLNENWLMIDGDRSYKCSVPCSVYDTLYKEGVIEHPYYRDNEKKYTSVSDRDFIFEKYFTLDHRLLSQDRLYLRFDGVDTLANIYLNGRYLGSCNNMHRSWEFDVKGIAADENTLTVEIASPTKYIAEAYKRRPLAGVEHCIEGYQHIRKAHYMFGWDWGTKLPDMGIWRGVSISGYSLGMIKSVYYTQKHENGRVLLTCKADFDIWTDGVTAEFVMTSPGQEARLCSKMQHNEQIIEINDPQLWWVHGLGEQPLYTCEVRLIYNGEIIDRHSKRIGLRTLTVSTAKDKWGEEFCFVNNGVKVFAMGGNYIPEDQIIPNCTKERTEKLLRDCVDANFNFIRVWGGGFYPDDCFYDLCDELGLIVWQDFMFACAAYQVTEDFESTVRAELRDNIIRLRNHASLGLWCGNNEIESAWVGWGWPDDPQGREDYIKLFEHIIPEAVLTCDPETFYWPSSPSSGGNFEDPSAVDKGDQHYWAVWHNFVPFEDFFRQHYRFCSEYGFESLPDIKTCRAFTDGSPEDLRLVSAIMQQHQKCTLGNEKLMFYLERYTGETDDFERMVYCSQLVQADCIRLFVEFMRRNRGRCMGSAYWQINDSNPVISWSGIDYYGRFKALHYAAKRFYAPVLISCDRTDPLHPVLYVTNDTPDALMLTVRCRLRDNRGEALKRYTEEIAVRPFSAAPVLKPEIASLLNTEEKRATRYLEFKLERSGVTISGNSELFVTPKEFKFLPVKIRTEITERRDRFEIKLSANRFAKSVCLSLRDHDAEFSDNWFDIHGSKRVTVTLPKFMGATAESIRRELSVVSY